MRCGAGVVEELFTIADVVGGAVVGDEVVGEIVTATPVVTGDAGDSNAGSSVDEQPARMTARTHHFRRRVRTSPNLVSI